MKGRRVHVVRIAAIAVAAISHAARADPDVVRLEAVGTAFRATLADGSVKEGRALEGAVLVFRIDGEPMRIRIASITPDATDKTGTILLHDFRMAATDEPLCAPAPDGTRLGFPLAGHTEPDGRFVESEATAFELICTAGGQGKCVRFGYRPWEGAPDGRGMREYFNACVRMLRADYCGDGTGWTRDGTLIDLWDDQRIQTSDSGSDPTFSFEAGWTPEGAVCVAHSRIPENIGLAALKTYCPRLAAVASCDDRAARAGGALLFNRSR